ncbi:MAG: FtsX-like permease family protein [Gemmatimonadetes bacterium]|nr:FtsX-like permease family protein [Gemmatimonadota bacterium]MYK51110.1 FtsX-like permease family protein [Gemmatimonadota bacterium]
MLRNYLTVAYRNLVRYKVYSAINITGLAIGIAFCILTFLYIHHEWTYDAFHKNADQIYRVYTEFRGPDNKFYRTPTVPTALRNELVQTATDVDQAVRLVAGRGDDPGDQEIQITYGDQIFKLPFLIVDPEFLDMFSFSLRSGDSEIALKHPQSVVLSAETAKKIFGDENPIGNQLTLRSLWSHERADFTVTGVADPIPDNSSIQFEMLLPYQHLWFFLRREADDWNLFSRCSTYVQLSENTKSTDIEPAMLAIVKAHMLRPEISADNLHLRLQPLTNLHHRIDLIDSTYRNMKAPRDPMNGYGLICLSLLVLVMASINFVNLAVGRLVTRTKEVGIRKVVGAVRPQLIRQFLSESVLLSLVAVVLGLSLAELVLPFFNKFMHQNLSFDNIFTWPTFVFLIALVAVVGLLIGSYPAFMISGFNPVRILTGRFKLSHRNLFGRGLVFGQFAVSSALITCTLIMVYQLQFVKEKDLGFSKEFVIDINTDSLHDFSGQHDLLKNYYLQHHKVVGGTTVGRPLLGWQSRYEGTGEQGQSLWVSRFYVDYDFVKTLEMKVLSGRDFNSNANDQAQGNILVNEELVKQMGWDDPIGQTITFEGRGVRVLRESKGVTRVIGVVQDFYLMPLQQNVQPAMLLLSPIGNSRNFLVRIKPGDVAETLKYLETGWKEIAPAGEPFYFTFVDEDIENYYRDFLSWSRIVGYATILAVFIACLGAFGLTALAVARRTKEIGIRKIMGASVLNIVSLLSREFVMLVIVASLCAWPLTYLIMIWWLQSFAYRIGLTAGVFALGGLLTLLVVIGTVSLQAVKAAKMNPVEALRYE